ncbi:hypothetical protein KEM55_001609, partial [Ascosphaera atra]
MAAQAPIPEQAKPPMPYRRLKIFKCQFFMNPRIHLFGPESSLVVVFVAGSNPSPGSAASTWHLYPTYKKAGKVYVKLRMRNAPTRLEMPLRLGTAAATTKATIQYTGPR